MRSVFLCFFIIWASLSGFSESKISQEHLTFFESKVRPILANNCYKCHSKDSKKLKGNLLLDSQAGWQAGGEHGAVIVPGDLKQSKLIKAIGYENKHLQMPPKEKLSQSKIDILKEWVRIGAPDPRTGDQEYVKNRNRIDILKNQKSYWAFKRLKTPSAPQVKNTTWSNQTIDRYILAKWEKAGITPNKSVSREKLIRRLYFDIIGLPPTSEQIDTYVNNKSTTATADLIDSLLASKHYGERWARHWMDVARFAESFGFEQDYDRPFAYYYRDFLIKAFNDDMPYDQFVQWQLAGDELAPENPQANMATGFLAAGVFPTQLTEKEFESARYDELDDIVNTTGTAFMGLTMGCARCHNHKYDPIPVADYYNFTANFATTIRSIDNLKFKQGSPFLKTAESDYKRVKRNLENYDETKLEKAYHSWKKKQGENLSKTKAPKNIIDLIHANYKDLEQADKNKLLTWYQSIDKSRIKLDKEFKLLKSNFENQKNRVMVMTEGLPHIPHHADGRGYPHFYKNVHHLKRGSPASKGDIAQPGFLQVLTDPSKTPEDWKLDAPKGWRTSYRRASLAKWMTDVEHGAGHLVARVMVNRLWQHHFGRGIVQTSNDFGAQGTPPTHPELLDYLAYQLIKNKWSLKSIQRIILNSQAYAISSDHHEHKYQLDPDNKLFWRKPVKRLEAEVIRDSMLSVSDSLDTNLYGPGIRNLDHQRRSIYFFLKRSKLIPMLRLFDMPSPLSSRGTRQVTTIAPQALMFINNSQIDTLAKKFSQKIESEKKHTKTIVQHAFKTALGRLPSDQELNRSVSFIDRSEDRSTGLADFSKALMSLNEFIYIE
jgi:hypothetical protein